MSPRSAMWWRCPTTPPLAMCALRLLGAIETPSSWKVEHLGAGVSSSPNKGLSMNMFCAPPSTCCREDVVWQLQQGAVANVSAEPSEQKKKKKNSVPSPARASSASCTVADSSVVNDDWAVQLFQATTAGNLARTVFAAWAQAIPTKGSLTNSGVGSDGTCDCVSGWWVDRR